MKRKAIFLELMVICLGSINAFAQPVNQAPKLPIDESTKLFSYGNVVEVAGTKDVLFNRAIDWCNNYYTNPSDVIREKDSVEGKIVCKARFKIMNPEDKKGVSTDAGNVMYSLTLLFKEGKYKYIITDLNWKQVSYFAAEKWMDTTSSSYKPEFDYYLKQTDDTIKDLIKNLDAAMKMPAPAKKSDW